ncbi:MAG: M3 family oligoendopeptidase [Bacteroidota bacterium]
MDQYQKEIKKNRKYLPVDLNVQDWSNLEPFYNELLASSFDNKDIIEEWLKKRSELNSVLEEEFATMYIRMTRDTANEGYSQVFNDFVTTVQPKIIEFSHKLDEKFINSPLLDELDQDKYHVMIRGIKKHLEIFREKNIPLFSELQVEEREFGKISSEMTIEYEGKELTLQQAAKYLKDPDRPVREKVYKLINDRRLQDSEKLNTLLTKLIEKRHQVGLNADFSNFRDYKFIDLGRFDYSVEDCYQFHESIREVVTPIVDNLYRERKNKLKLDELRPWDLEVDKDLKPPLQPFDTASELIEKSIECFSKIRPKYGNFLSMMNKHGYLDLESRKGKAPGGYNYPLYESNIPFIFMNAAGNFRDLETMMHEGGHAIHSFLSKDLELTYFKSLPSEVAELASMSMELISMEHWSIFFPGDEELNRAKKGQLEGIIKVLPWIATIDKFQHWLYLHPNHTSRERLGEWISIFNEFSSDQIEWGGFEEYLQFNWQKQLHIFEVPFYYIEYGIAQLGALAIWRNFKKNPEKALNDYEKALSLGYSVTIPEIYETAGINFSFEKNYIKDLINFTVQELNKLS